LTHSPGSEPFKTSRLRVLLADDHAIVRRGVRGLVQEAGYTVVGEASDGLEAIRLCEELHPHVLILDVNMPKRNGIDVAARLRSMERPPAVIMLSMYADESHVIRALEAGARGYLLKSSSDEDLVPALKAVFAGKPFFSPAVTGVLIEDYVHRLQMRGLTDTLELLTDREKQVLQLLAEGRSMKEVGAILNVAPRTVAFHKYRMMEQLRIRTSAELVQFAVKHGIVGDASVTMTNGTAA